MGGRRTKHQPNKVPTFQDELIPKSGLGYTNAVCYPTFLTKTHSSKYILPATKYTNTYILFSVPQQLVDSRTKTQIHDCSQTSCCTLLPCFSERVGHEIKSCSGLGQVFFQTKYVVEGIAYRKENHCFLKFLVRFYIYVCALRSPCKIFLFGHCPKSWENKDLRYPEGSGNGCFINSQMRLSLHTKATPGGEVS